jgi:hypothetical protein
MELNKFNHHIATDAALSNFYTDHLVSKETHYEGVANRMEHGIDRLILLGNEIVDRYDEARNEYNDSVQDYKERVHYVPQLKVKIEKEVSYVRFVWCQLQNREYRLRARKTHQSGIEEIQAGPKGFYTAKKLNSLLDHNNKNALSLLLETEHAMRYIRQEYQQYANIRRLVSGLRNSRYQQLRKHQTLDEKLSKTEEQELQKLNFELMLQVSSFDPFNIPVKKSLFKPEKLSINGGKL